MPHLGSEKTADEAIRAALSLTHLVNLSITNTSCACEPAPCGLSEVERGRAGCAAGGGCEGWARSPRERGDAARPREKGQQLAHLALPSRAQSVAIGPPEPQIHHRPPSTYLLNILADDSERAAMEWSDRGRRRFDLERWKSALQNWSGSKEAREEVGCRIHTGAPCSLHHSERHFIRTMR